MSPDAWTFLGTAVVTVGGWVTVLLNARRQHAENRAAQQTLVERSKQLVPNGNRPILEGGSLADALHRLEVLLVDVKVESAMTHEQLITHEALSSADRRTIRHGLRNVNAALEMHLDAHRDSEDGPL